MNSGQGVVGSRVSECLEAICAEVADFSQSVATKLQTSSGLHDRAS